MVLELSINRCVILFLLFIHLSGRQRRIVVGRHRSGRTRETSKTSGQIPRRPNNFSAGVAGRLFHRHRVVGRMVARVRRRQQKVDIFARFRGTDHVVDLVTVKGITP